MNARTPGPWRYSYDDASDRVTIGNDAVEIASVNTENCDDIETALVASAEAREARLREALVGVLRDVVGVTSVPVLVMAWRAVVRWVRR